MTQSFEEHRQLALSALRAKRGKLAVESLGRRATTLYRHLTTSELEELALVGAKAAR